LNWPLPKRTWLALLAIVCLLAPAAVAQVDATQWRTGLVKLLTGWRAHEGDNSAWAAAGFDDTEWENARLDDLGPAQLGWRWYRLHVKLRPEHTELHILIAGGEGTYELYINGAKSAGADIRRITVTRPTEQIFVVPDDAENLVLALRTYGGTNYTTWHLPLFLSAAIGTPQGIADDQASFESGRLYAALPSIAINLAVILAGIGAFALYGSQRKRAEYRWLGLYLVLLGSSNLLFACAQNGVLSLAWNNLVADPLIYFFTIMQIEFTFSFAEQRVTRAWRAYEMALVLPLLVTASLYFGIVSATFYLLIEAVVILPAAVLLPVLLFLWYRRGNREAGWLILPSLLPTATTALFDIGSASQFTGLGGLAFLLNPINVGGVPLQWTDLANFLFVLAIAVVMFFRFTRVSREQARTAAELSAAREIQRKLVPETLPEIKGYQVEAAYFPADEVGGDFYQVMETHDGATLLVVGDVSGKGLKAAMTGTLALGALRALAGETLSPGAILTRLNRHLSEMGNEGFVTCLCARITPQGEVTVANAGHLPPYRNGEEMLLEPDVPLGLVPEAHYAERVFRLDLGDRLTLLSDGVVEARNPRGELFGFERTQAISAQSADAIAEAALRYGQADDITVLTLTRSRTTGLAAQAQTATATG
jgi:hypothetical protein